MYQKYLIVYFSLTGTILLWYFTQITLKNTQLASNRQNIICHSPGGEINFPGLDGNPWKGKFFSTACSCVLDFFFLGPKIDEFEAVSSLHMNTRMLVCFYSILFFAWFSHHFLYNDTLLLEYAHAGYSAWKRWQLAIPNTYKKFLTF